jgi:hypothetical protein
MAKKKKVKKLTLKDLKKVKGGVGHKTRVKGNDWEDKIFGRGKEPGMPTTTKNNSNS